MGRPTRPTSTSKLRECTASAPSPRPCSRGRPISMGVSPFIATIALLRPAGAGQAFPNTHTWQAQCFPIGYNYALEPASQRAGACFSASDKRKGGGFSLLIKDVINSIMGIWMTSKMLRNRHCRHRLLNSIFKVFQVDSTGMFRMTSFARYFKYGRGSRCPSWRWIRCFVEWPKANSSCKACVNRWRWP